MGYDVGVQSCWREWAIKPSLRSCHPSIHLPHRRPWSLHTRRKQ